MSETLDRAVSKYLENEKAPSRKAGELDNRGSHFFLAQYWANELARQDEDTELRKYFEKAANELLENEATILKEIAAVEGKPTDIGGYYLPNDNLAEKAMRPSAMLNTIIDAL